jgi:excisionase family DNA binding protein
MPRQSFNGQTMGESSGNDNLMTVPEAAEFLHLNPGTLYHFVSQKRVPVIRISSRCIRFSRRALSEWIESLTEPPNHRRVLSTFNEIYRRTKKETI